MSRDALAAEARAWRKTRWTKLLFLATEDWFVRSHFSHLVARAIADGYETVVAARLGAARASLEGLGARTIDLPMRAAKIRLSRLPDQSYQTRELLARERPALVHAIALKPVDSGDVRR